MDLWRCLGLDNGLCLLFCDWLLVWLLLKLFNWLLYRLQVLLNNWFSHRFLNHRCQRWYYLLHRRYMLRLHIKILFDHTARRRTIFPLHLLHISQFLNRKKFTTFLQLLKAFPHGDLFVKNGQIVVTWRNIKMFSCFYE